MKAENLSQSNETSSSKKGSDLFDEELFKECLKRDLHAKPVGGQKLNDFGRQMYTSAREAYLSQPWYVRLFYSKAGRMKKAMFDTMAIHEETAQAYAGGQKHGSIIERKENRRWR